jgi:cob(I)alamin adenosyltransferase
MVYISKVYTKSGDGGQTMLASGDFVDKDDARIEAYGSVDELNATLGQMRIEIAREPRRARAAEALEELDGELGRIQQELFNLGAELATPGAADGEAKLVVHEGDVERLERQIDAHNAPLPALRSFILPGGGPVGAASHVARTVCRRAERRTVSLGKLDRVRPEAIRYLNRLSDYLFVVGRAVAAHLGDDEVLWTQEVQ